MGYQKLSNSLGLTPSEYDQLKQKILYVCQKSLDQAERDWEYTDAEKKLVQKSERMNENLTHMILDSALPSNIPGHKLVDKPKISD